MGVVYSLLGARARERVRTRSMEEFRGFLSSHHPSDEDIRGGGSSGTCTKKTTARKDDALTSLVPPRSRADTEEAPDSR